MFNEANMFTANWLKVYFVSNNNIEFERVFLIFISFALFFRFKHHLKFAKIYS